MNESTIWLRVDKQSHPPCWRWTGSISTGGYGQTAARIRGERQAHRVIYTLLKGQIPEGLTLDHLCRNRWCCNPAHLEPVTHRENILRGVGPAAVRAKATHCQNGHLFDVPNTYRDGRYRRCRACNRAAAKRYQDRQVAAFG